MPYRDRLTVQSWLSDFQADRGHDDLDIAVLDKDFEAGPDSGLVVVSLRNAPTITYAHPVMEGGVPRWVITFEPREGEINLSPPMLERLAVELAVLGELCVFLQLKTDALLLSR